jgi:hypothetical protein
MTPSQLAHFYRAVNGNYDPLFLSTPSSTIAFIYKNLGCLHSLQPLLTQDARFADPVVPALKVDGWIMWQTVQLLLGPDEHSEFLRQAVQMWDVKNADTGESFPKILPRSCFPPHADATMVSWYEGMSSRLRHEAEEQERIRVYPIEDRPDTPNSSKHAIAYFHNPLFRTVDGRPGVVRMSSRRRPPISPRDSFVQKSKTVASTFGNVIKNVGSPHLWDGHSTAAGTGAAAAAAATPTTKEKDHRRGKSLPDKQHYQDLDGEDDEQSPRSYSRRGSAQESTEQQHHRHHTHLHPSPTYHDPPSSRHRRPHTSNNSPHGYFPATINDEATQDISTDMRRSNSASYLHNPLRSGSPVKFGPSVSPLWATHVARGEGQHHHYHRRTSSHSRPPSAKSPELTTATEASCSSSRHSGEGSGSEVGGASKTKSGVGERRRVASTSSPRFGSRLHETMVSDGVGVGRKHHVDGLRR